MIDKVYIIYFYSSSHCGVSVFIISDVIGVSDCACGGAGVIIFQNFFVIQTLLGQLVCAVLAQAYTVTIAFCTYRKAVVLPENKETAAKIINLMNTEKGKDLYNMLVWGIEGEHYTVTGADRIETIGYTGQGTTSAPYGLWKWVVGNTKNAYMTQSDSEEYKEFVFERFNEGEDTLVSRAIGFSPDLTEYQSQLAQLSSVDGEYTKPLMYGAVANYESVYAEFMDKIKKCESDKIRDEIQKQLDEFMASK